MRHYNDGIFGSTPYAGQPWWVWLAGGVGLGLALKLAKSRGYVSNPNLPDPELLLRRPDAWFWPLSEKEIEQTLKGVVAAVKSNFTPERWANGIRAGVLVGDATSHWPVVVDGLAPLMAMVGHHRRLEWDQVEELISPKELEPMFEYMRGAGIIPADRKRK